ncbi:MAG: radical SAM protein, partial [Rhodospirillaceae bacterium]|nr:radical SAM protein [Rhodospirillaceae bacterium]
MRSYVNGDTEVTSGPVELIIEITSVCNLACIMCPRNVMVRPDGYMALELFKSIVDQIKDTVELIYLSGGLGEPLVHPDLTEMIDYCRLQNVRVGVSTNATLLKREIAGRILDAGPDILLLSLDGATKETHESIRVGSVFERTMGNVEYFLEEKER